MKIATEAVTALKTNKQIDVGALFKFKLSISDICFISHGQQMFKIEK